MEPLVSSVSSRVPTSIKKPKKRLNSSHKITHVNWTWETLALSQDCESVVKCGYVVLRCFFADVSRIVSLKWQSWVAFRNRESGGACVDLVENSMQNAWRASQYI